jgi:hypothetical protein
MLGAVLRLLDPLAVRPGHDRCRAHNTYNWRIDCVCWWACCSHKVYLHNTVLSSGPFPWHFGSSFRLSLWRKSCCFGLDLGCCLGAIEWWWWGCKGLALQYDWSFISFGRFDQGSSTYALVLFLRVRVECWLVILTTEGLCSLCLLPSGWVLSWLLWNKRAVMGVVCVRIVLLSITH